MAGSTLQTSSDSQNVVSNPAGLGFMKRGDASVTYSQDTISGNENSTYREVEQEENGGQVLVAGPLGPYADDLPEYGNFGLGWSGYDGEVDNDPFDAETDGYRITGAYAIALSDTTSIGYSLAYFNDEYRNNLYDYSMTDGFRNTIGIAERLDDLTTLGISAFWGFGTHDIDIYGDQSGESEQDEYGIAVGLSHQLMPETLVSFGLDYEYYESDGDVQTADPAVVFGGDEDGHVMNVRAGIEQAITDQFKLRGGYQYGSNFQYNYERDELEDIDGDSAKFNGWSAGAGFSLPIGREYFVEAVNVDYGVQYRAIGDDDWQHVVTLSAPFSPCD